MIGAEKWVLLRALWWQAHQVDKRILTALEDRLLSINKSQHVLENVQE
jgi:hypothetical protein